MSISISIRQFWKISISVSILIRQIWKISKVDISANLKNIDIDKEILKNVNIVKEILENIDIEKVSNQLEFCISNRAIVSPDIKPPSVDMTKWGKRHICYQRLIWIGFGLPKLLHVSLIWHRKFKFIDWSVLYIGDRMRSAPLCSHLPWASPGGHFQTYFAQKPLVGATHCSIRLGWTLYPWGSTHTTATFFIVLFSVLQTRSNFYKFLVFIVHHHLHLWSRGLQILVCLVNND